MKIRNPFVWKEPEIHQPEEIVGEVFIYTDAQSLVPFKTLREFEISKGKKELEEEKSWYSGLDLRPRPYEPESFLALYDHNPIFAGTVNQIASDIAGLGWSLQLKQDKKENKEEREKIEAFLEHPNPDDSLRGILEALMIDWGVLGYWALQVVRNAGGEVVEIYDTAAYEMWIHRSGRKYCRRRGSQELWFKKFGLKDGDDDPIQISPKTGEEGSFDIEDAANELIFYRRHHPRYIHYGVPLILPAVGSVILLIGARDYNISFFESYGVPTYMVTLTGKWKPGSDQKIRNFMNTEVKGSDNAHKTLVLQLPTGGEIEAQKLSVESKEGSFRLMVQLYREDIWSSYSMPPSRKGIAIVGRLGGNIAEEATKIYKQSVVNPLQEDVENIVNRKLLEEGLGCSSYKWELNELDTEDEDKELDRHCKRIEHGLETPNQARGTLDLGEPYPLGDRFYMNRSLIPVDVLDAAGVQWGKYMEEEKENAN